MKQCLIAMILLGASLFATNPKADVQGDIGVVNFGSCMTDSKLGKQEQNSFESFKKQMTSVIEETQKELSDLAAKLEDQEYLDGLSSESEEAMKHKFFSLKEELGRSQNQFYTLLNQKNMRVMQTMSESIAEAAEKVAKEKNLTCVLNKDLCFYNAAVLDVTENVIVEMDNRFEAKKQAALEEVAP
jgi:outer membrane protein